MRLAKNSVPHVMCGGSAIVLYALAILAQRLRRVRNESKSESRSGCDAVQHASNLILCMQILMT